MASPKIPKVKSPAEMKMEMAVGRARDVLPKAEREINLGNMLRESAVKERMYHASPHYYDDDMGYIKTAPDEGISSFKLPEDLKKMGSETDPTANALFMTPSYEFANKFSGTNIPDPLARPAIYPMYVQAKNPFDYENPKHIENLRSYLIEHRPNDIDDDAIVEYIKHLGNPKTESNWTSIENPEIQESIKELGHDSFYAKEKGVKNLGVYNPNAVKSAIGNRGTYDTSDPDITKAHGGIVKMSKGGLKPVKAPKVSASKVESPTVMKRSDVSDLFRLINEREGSYGAKRVERAADEIPNLEKLYTLDALRSAFSGDNARALMTLKPADFEKYAAPLLTNLSQQSNDNIANLKAIQNVGGFSDVPFFLVNKELAGSTGLPWITGHEGRHRNRAMDEAGVQAGLVQFLPRAELREPFPRKSQEQYIDAIRKEMALSGNKVKPEKYYLNENDEKSFQRPTIDLPDLYADGGAVKMKDGGDPEREFYDQLREGFSVYNKPTYGNEIPSTPTIDQQRYELSRQGQREAENRARTTRDNLTAMDPSGTLGIVDALKTVGKAVVAPIAYVGGNAFDWLQTGKVDPAKSKARGERLESWMQPKTEEGGEILEEISKVGPALTGSEMGFGMHPNLWASGIGLTTPKQTAAGLRLGAERVAPFAKDVGEMASEMYMRGDIPGMVSPNAYVIKPKGGNWIDGGIDRAVDPLKVRLNDQMISGEMINEMAGEDLWSKIVSEGKQGSSRNWLYSNRPDVFDKIYGRESIPINNWIDTKLKKYVKNEMGTPEDPLRKLADQGKLHTNPDELPRTMVDEFTDVSPTGHLGERRTVAGFPAKSYAETLEGKNWEASADSAIQSRKAAELLDLANSEKSFNTIKELVAENPWLSKVDPNTNIYKLSPSTFADLNFSHVVDELKNSMRIDSDLPEKLRINPTKLEKMTVPQVVERVSEINKWRAENQAAANEKLANNAATQLVKDYPDQGFKWMELRKPEDLTELPEGFTVEPYKSEYSEGVKILRPDGTQASAGDTVDQALKNMSETMLDDALKYEGDTMGHCVGSYCSDVISGETRIYSLRDSKGEPHVTIEVQPKQIKTWDDVTKAVGSDEASKLWNEFNDIGANNMSDVEAGFQMFMKNKGVELPPEIIQVKGKGNAKPKDAYLPFVQDFVKSGKWSAINDFKNTGLVHAGLTGKLMTPAEHADWLASQRNAPPDGMKRGGKVQFAKSLDAMRHELTKAK
jgi:hypothetical protein